MKRQVSLEEISDGKLYGGADLVKADVRTAKAAAPAAMGWGSPLS